MRLCSPWELFAMALGVHFDESVSRLSHSCFTPFSKIMWLCYSVTDDRQFSLRSESVEEVLSMAMLGRDKQMIVNTSKSLRQANNSRHK